MPITNELRALIANAGHVATREREARERWQRDQDAERRADARTRSVAENRARRAAVDVFANGSRGKTLTSCAPACETRDSITCR